MIKLNLSRDEARMLSEVLRQYVSDLRMEIANTDLMSFRENLKDKECFLKRVIEELSADLP